MEEFPDVSARFQDTILEKAFEIAELAHLSQAERAAYETSLKHYRDMINVVDTAQMEGEFRGEQKAQLKIARKMLAQNFSYEQIKMLTGLSDEELNVLHEEHPYSEESEPDQPG